MCIRDSANPIQLMQSEKRGEKDSKLVVPMALLGAGMLGVAYYFAWTVENSGTAMGIFFILVLLVILATNLLFTSGSIAVLRTLRANRRFYYKPKNFVSVSGMFHRMRQNAASLATICILSTMFLVTLAGTLSLYLGQEKTLAMYYPYDANAGGYPIVLDLSLIHISWHSCNACGISREARFPAAPCFLLRHHRFHPKKRSILIPSRACWCESEF